MFISLASLYSEIFGLDVIRGWLSAEHFSMQPCLAYNCSCNVVLSCIDEHCRSCGEGTIEEGKGTNVFTGGVLSTMGKDPSYHQEVNDREQNAVVKWKEQVPVLKY